MSRIGKQPIELPESVEVKLEGNVLTVKGAKGELTQEIHPLVQLDIGDKELNVTVVKQTDQKQAALWGLFRSLIAGMVTGVTDGFEKKLEISGVGYKAAMEGKNLVLHVGYSHPINFDIPEGITIEADKTSITVAGIDKQKVGQVAAEIRAFRKVEPYKGKGIKYSDEVVRRKVGKVAGKTE